MNGFERRKERKKTAILQAALALFLKHGMDKVSVVEIAKSAKVSQVTIYNYFNSKDNLIRKTLIYYIDEIWAEYEQLFTSNLSFIEKVQKIIFDKAVIAEEINEDFYQHFMKEYTGEDNYILQFYKETAFPRFLELFEEGKQQGYVDPSISNEAIMVYLQMFVDYIRRDEVAGTVLPLTEELTKLFFYGISGNREEKDSLRR
jgi:AcrR family transcriptional regulator